MKGSTSKYKWRGINLWPPKAQVLPAPWIHTHVNTQAYKKLIMECVHYKVSLVSQLLAPMARDLGEMPPFLFTALCGITES